MIVSKEGMRVTQSLLPGEDHDHDSTENRLKWWSGFVSWKFGVIFGAICSFLVFAINLSVMIWGMKIHHVDDDHQVTLFEGECSQMKRLNIISQLVINILGTILLAACNYCM